MEIVTDAVLFWLAIGAGTGMAEARISKAAHAEPPCDHADTIVGTMSLKRSSEGSVPSTTPFFFEFLFGRLVLVLKSQESATLPDGNAWASNGFFGCAYVRSPAHQTAHRA